MILFLGGDGEMKTRVMNVLSAESLPSTAWDGTIALISPLDVGRVYVDASVPDAPNVGDVQIRPNLSSSYAYVIGDVTVPYADIYQYNGAAWEKMTYYRYDGTEWKPGRVYLLDGGNTPVPWKTYTWYAATVTKNEEGYKIRGGTENQPGAIQTEHRVDLTGFSTLHCFLHNDNAINTKYVAQFGIQDTQAYVGAEYNGTEVIIEQSAAKVARGEAGEYDLAIDIAAFDGEYYVGCLSANQNTQVYQIWLEV